MLFSILSDRNYKKVVIGTPDYTSFLAVQDVLVELFGFLVQYESNNSYRITKNTMSELSFSKYNIGIVVITREFTIRTTTGGYMYTRLAHLYEQEAPSSLINRHETRFLTAEEFLNLAAEEELKTLSSTLLTL